MSGADLANLVNEAALHAVRRGSEWIHMEDFEAARDRVLMGQRRESMALSDDESKAIRSLLMLVGTSCDQRLEVQNLTDPDIARVFATGASINLSIPKA